VGFGALTAGETDHALINMPATEESHGHHGFFPYFFEWLGKAACAFNTARFAGMPR
jgi:hypothetical protein